MARFPSIVLTQDIGTADSITVTPGSTRGGRAGLLLVPSTS